MTTFVTQDKVILYVQPDGPNTAAKPLSIDKHGMADKTHPNPGREVVWGTDAFGRFVPKLTFLSPPGGLNTSTVEEDDTGTFSFLKKMYDRIGCFPLQERWYKCGRKDGPGWTRVLGYGKMTITQKTLGAAPSREATGASVFDSFEVSWPYTVELYEHALSAQTISEDQNINDVVFLSDLVVGCNDCFPGYAPDTIGYLAVNSNAGSPGDFANVWYTTNAGGAWAITSTNPFLALQSILFVEIGFISDTQFRVIVVSDQTTNQVKTGDFTLGAEGTSSWSSAVNILGTSIVTAFDWLFYDRLYASTAGDIYLSTNQGDSFGAAIFTGTNVLNDFARSPQDDSVWAVGASNTILRELGQSSTFDTMIGPTAGGDFTAITIANDGRIYAGNGTSIYLCDNGALNAGGWTALKDFGTNKVVKTINCAGGTKSGGGDSQFLRVVVDDTAGSNGTEWESVDGGATWRQTTILTNTGYNAAYFSSVDDNLAWIVGDAGVIHKLQAKVV